MAIDPRAVIEEFLDSHDLDYDRGDENTFLVTLPGETKLQTHCALVVGDHSLSINAFVIRKPDENEASSKPVKSSAKSKKKEDDDDDLDDELPAKKSSKASHSSILLRRLSSMLMRSMPSVYSAMRGKGITTSSLTLKALV